MHNVLLLRCQAAVHRVQDNWRHKQGIEPVILLWPNTSVRTDDGTDFSGVLFDTLPSTPENRKGAIQSKVARCDAFAVLAVEELDNAVRLLFESRCGTRSWRLPIKRQGDLKVLGQPEHRDNAEAIGVLWLAN